MGLVQKPEMWPFIPSEQCSGHMCSTTYSRSRASVLIHLTVTYRIPQQEQFREKEFIWFPVSSVGKSRQQELEVATSIPFTVKSREK